MNRRLALGALTACALLASAGVAVANASLKTASSEKTLGAVGGSVTARCQRGSEAVSGGFANPDFDPSGSGSQFLPINSRRKGERGFKTAVVNEESESGRFIAYAYCDPHEPGLGVSFGENFGVPAEQLGSAVARCPRGSEAVSGGFQSPDFANVSPGSDVFPIDSRRTSERQCKLTGYNDGTESGRLKAYAYCDPREPGLKTRSKDASISSSGVGSAIAKCPEGSEAVAGGFEGNFVQVMSGFAGTSTFTSKRTGTRTWKASGYASEPASTLTSFAYCKK